MEKPVLSPDFTTEDILTLLNISSSISVNCGNTIMK